MPLAKHIVVIAGEESGDKHAAELIRQFKQKHPLTHFSGIGGKHMAKAGAEVLCDLASYGVTGLSEVLKHLPKIKKAFKTIKQHLKTQRPDLVILVDYPGFNLRLAKYIKLNLNLRILYYISPQIWAWKANRIHRIRQCVDRMAVIFPFEKELYEKEGVAVSFVGHPLVESITIPKDTKHLTAELNLPNDKRLIALLPGSRTHEIQQHMPIFSGTIKKLAKNYDNLHFIIPVAGTVSQELIRSYIPKTYLSAVTLISGKALEVISCSELVLVASGTASLETALLAKPMCIVYKSSLLTYLAASRLIRVKYLGLCNLLAQKMIVPELLQYDFNVVELTHFVSQYLNDASYGNKLIERLMQLKKQLSADNADCSLLELVEKEVELGLEAV